jgi:mannose-6-phosphate isomerase-like protein (cupin superfamily)
MKIIKPYKIFKDQRGTLVGIINDGKWEEINYLETEKNQTRGNHYHKNTEEMFYILDGTIKVIVKNIKTKKKQEKTVKKGAIVLINPFELHTFISRTKCKWINVLSKKIEDSSPDIHKI